MSLSMDEERILARIERGLARDDPALASRIDTLNRQFTGELEDGPERPGLRVLVGAALGILALLGLIIAAMLAERPAANDPPARPGGPAPAASVQTQRRDQRPPGGQGDHLYLPPPTQRTNDGSSRSTCFRPA
jgi:hypothetical protein